MQFRYVVLEGPIGVGKSTVVERLAQRVDATRILEDWWKDNPFLKRFYDGEAGATFQLELFFLLSRYKQQQELLQRTLFQEFTLSDYLFEKSKLFAYLNLEDSELIIYEKLYALLAESVPRPDLVVYLQAPTEVLMKRIRARAGRGGAPLGGVHGRGEPRLQPLLLPLLADAAARGQHRRRGLREARRGRRRSLEADPGDGQGHAVLRADGVEVRLRGVTATRGRLTRAGVGDRIFIV
jgi:thymidylate kinase